MVIDDCGEVMLRGPVVRVAAVCAWITARNLSGRMDTALVVDPEQR